MSDQHKINFLDNKESSEEVVDSKTTPKMTIEQLSEEQKSKKLSNKFDTEAQKIMTSKHISSARTGGISDMGGPGTFTKSDSANTIWDADKNAKASQSMDNKSKTIQEKEHIASNKRDAENKRVSDLAETLKSTLLDKASTVSSAGILSGTNYKESEKNMSIFDNKDFMRVVEQTEGEKLSADIKQRKSQVDDSWRNGGKVVSSKKFTKDLFDGLFTSSE